MNFDRMREVILDKAVRGELVSQLAEDGVVAQIGNTPKEELFPIPKSWKWCSLNMVAQVIAGQSPKGTALTTDSNDTEFHQGKTFFGRQYIQNSGAYTNEPTKIAPKESILLSVRAPVGAVNLTDRKICIGRGLFAIVPNEQLLVKFLYFVLLTKTRELQSKSTGTTFKAVTGKVVRDLYVPVPPLKEQARIVDKVSDALAEIDRAEKAYEELQTLAGVLREQILQEAIQGKLLPQLAEEGVVEQIGATPEEVPFTIPSSWKWQKVIEIAKVMGGKRVPAGDKLIEENTGYPYIRVSDMKDGGVDTSGLLYLTEDCREKIKRYTISCNDIYVTVAGTIGRVGIIPKELDGANLTENADKIVLTSDFVIRDWLLLVLSSRYCQTVFKERKTKVGQPKLAIKRIESIMIPVPPVEEQRLVVSKVEELMAQVDALLSR